jgi:hypothetical protein
MIAYWFVPTGRLIVWDSNFSHELLNVHAFSECQVEQQLAQHDLTAPIIEPCCPFTVERA